ncbi:unnamed protein product, partial [Mesorhabditis spiculigera]
MKPSKSVEDELEDYIWGKANEQQFLQRVVNETGTHLDSMLRRVKQTEESLNKHIRKGVEQNLPKLFEQATALEELDRTQRVVDAEVNEIYMKSEAVQRRIQQLTVAYEKRYKELEEAHKQHRLLKDVHRCLELMDAFEKRSDIVKRSEIILEIEFLVKVNTRLVEVIKTVVTTKLKAAQNQVRSSAASDLRSALSSLDASQVASAVRALSNLNYLDAELDTHLARSVAEIETSLDALNQQKDNVRAMMATVNLIQNSMEQASMLGQQHLAKALRTRLSATAPYCLKFIQQLNRILNGLSAEAVAPLTDALRPVKKEILNQGLQKVQRQITEHNFADGYSHAFVDGFNSALLEEQTNIEWDPDMRETFVKNVKTCIDTVAVRLEKEIRLEPENLLLGDRLLAAQQANYCMLGIGGLLASKWEGQSENLKKFVGSALGRIFQAVRSSVSAIVGSMHQEKLGGRECSLYMAELLAYLERVGGHCAHLGPVLRLTSALGPLIDHTLLLFLAHASLVSPMSPEVRAQLARDATRLFDACTMLHPSTLFGDVRPLAMLFASDDVETISEIPTWLIIQTLIAQSDASLKRPHESVEWDQGQYVEWMLAQEDAEKYSFLSNLLSSYTSSVVSRGGTEFVANYPRLIALLDRAVKASS